MGVQYWDLPSLGASHIKLPNNPHGRLPHIPKTGVPRARHATSYQRLTPRRRVSCHKLPIERLTPRRRVSHVADFKVGARHVTEWLGLQLRPVLAANVAMSVNFEVPAR